MDIIGFNDQIGLSLPKIALSKFKKPIHTPFLGFIFRSRFLIVLLYPFACLLMATLRINSDLAFV